MTGASASLTLVLQNICPSGDEVPCLGGLLPTLLQCFPLPPPLSLSPPVSNQSTSFSNTPFPCSPSLHRRRRPWPGANSSRVWLLGVRHGLDDNDSHRPGRGVSCWHCGRRARGGLPPAAGVGVRLIVVPPPPLAQIYDIRVQDKEAPPIVLQPDMSYVDAATRFRRMQPCSSHSTLDLVLLDSDALHTSFSSPPPLPPLPSPPV